MGVLDYSRSYEFLGSSGSNATKGNGLWEPGTIGADISGNRVRNFPRFKRHLEVSVNGLGLNESDYTLARMAAPNSIYRYVEITSQDIADNDKVRFTIHTREV